MKIVLAIHELAHRFSDIDDYAADVEDFEFIKRSM